MPLHFGLVFILFLVSANYGFADADTGHDFPGHDHSAPGGSTSMGPPPSSLSSESGSGSSGGGSSAGGADFSTGNGAANPMPQATKGNPKVPSIDWDLLAARDITGGFRRINRLEVQSHGRGASPAARRRAAQVLSGESSAVIARDNVIRPSSLRRPVDYQGRPRTVLTDYTE